MVRYGYSNPRMAGAWMRWRDSEQGQHHRDYQGLKDNPLPVDELERRLREVHLAGFRAGASEVRDASES